MTENLNLDKEPDIDFDAWLAGGARKAHYVTLYARADLFALLEQLQQQLRVEQQATQHEATIGGDSPTKELEDRIEAVYTELYASRREFRVSALIEDEVEAIRKQVRKDLKDAADEVAAEAREEAKTMAKRLGITAPTELNTFLRGRSLEAVNKLVEAETSLRCIAASLSAKQGDGWLQLSEDQVRTLHAKIGGAQIDLLNRAFSRAANEAPVVTVPKS